MLSLISKMFSYCHGGTVNILMFLIYTFFAIFYFDFLEHILIIAFSIRNVCSLSTEKSTNFPRILNLVYVEYTRAHAHHINTNKIALAFG